MQVGRQEPVMVLRVDKEKGYIDLSKRRVSPEDIAAAEERFNKSKMVHSIMRHTAETTGSEVGCYFVLSSHERSAEDACMMCCCRPLRDH